MDRAIDQCRIPGLASQICSTTALFQKRTAKCHAKPLVVEPLQYDHLDSQQSCKYKTTLDYLRDQDWLLSCAFLM
jgi:hypothetical protein